MVKLVDSNEEKASFKKIMKEINTDNTFETELINAVGCDRDVQDPFDTCLNTLADMDISEINEKINAINDNIKSDRAKLKKLKEDDDPILGIYNGLLNEDKKLRRDIDYLMQTISTTQLDDVSEVDLSSVKGKYDEKILRHRRVNVELYAWGAIGLVLAYFTYRKIKTM